MGLNSSIINCDILIVGSGYSGSLTALMLHQSGFRVCLVEKKAHPRFTIGESSTPIADMILRRFAEQYDLPWLKKFSRYGSWQKNYSNLPCGIKRGFSYFNLQKGRSFTTDTYHSNELLVAASNDNLNSDTNWFRSNFDHHLVKKVQEYGILYFDHTEVLEASKTNDGWVCAVDSTHGINSINCRFFVDASGAGMVAQQLFEASLNTLAHSYHTQSRAVYGHFAGVLPWTKKLKEQNISTSDYPYNPDHSANHLLLEEGWLWLLRFNNGITSAGLVLDLDSRSNANHETDAEELWHNMIRSYPDVAEIFKHSQLTISCETLRDTGQLQRRMDTAKGFRWAALPNTVGFVDPLHSTGIAHALSGVEKLVDILIDYPFGSPQLDQKLDAYEKTIHQELDFIDLLVAGCYRALPDFKLFTLWSMLYFTATVWYEQLRLQGHIPSHFLCAGHSQIRQMTKKLFDELNSLLIKYDNNVPAAEIESFRETIKIAISPYNKADLLRHAANNMYHHTAVDLS